jgi:hypothetical protein
MIPFMAAKINVEHKAIGERETEIMNQRPLATVFLWSSYSVHGTWCLCVVAPAPCSFCLWYPRDIAPYTPAGGLPNRRASRGQSKGER